MGEEASPLPIGGTHAQEAHCTYLRNLAPLTLTSYQWLSAALSRQSGTRRARYRLCTLAFFCRSGKAVSATHRGADGVKT